MDAESQRKFIADAAARGITLVEFLKEFQADEKLSTSVYSELYPRPKRVGDVPSSDCPVIAAVFVGMGRLSNYEGRDLSEWLSDDPRSVSASTMEQQAERATICARWFRATVLSLMETERLLVPAGDVAKACKPLLEALTEEAPPPTIAAAALESALAILNACGSECARQNKGAFDSTVRIQMGSAMRDLWSKLFPWVPPGESQPVEKHVHPDGDLDRALTLTEASTGGLPTGEMALDDDLIAQLNAAELAMGFAPSDGPGVFIPAGDTSPGGVLKK